MEAGDRGRRRELRRAGVAAAREARGLLASAMDVLQRDGISGPETIDMAAQVQVAVSSLFGAEVESPEGVRDRLRDASGALGQVLAALHGPPGAQAIDEAGALIARTLAILYPARAELDRELAPPVDLSKTIEEELPLDEPEPVLLTQPRASHPRVEPIPLRAPDTLRAAPPTAAQPRAPAGPGVNRPRRKMLELVPDAQEGFVERQSGTSGSERRTALRRTIEADIGFFSETHFFAGFAGDISDGGIFVATYDVLPLGTELTVSFVLPGGHQIVASGHVAWVRDARDRGLEGQPGMGVRFSSLSSADRAAITQFLAVRPPMFHA